MKDICKNCGGWKGLHHSETGQCPLGGVERFPNVWTFTTYEPTDTSHEAAQRLAEAAKYIEYAMPEDDPENEEVVTIHLTPKGLRDFRAALAEWEAAK